MSIDGLRFRLFFLTHKQRIIFLIVGVLFFFEKWRILYNINPPPSRSFIFCFIFFFKRRSFKLKCMYAFVCIYIYIYVIYVCVRMYVCMYVYVCNDYLFIGINITIFNRSSSWCKRHLTLRNKIFGTASSLLLILNTVGIRQVYVRSGEPGERSARTWYTCLFK